MAEEKNVSVVYQDRRYISRRETWGYIMFNASGGILISDYFDRYNLDVLKIDLGWMALIRFINFIWDISNDTFSAALVDKTRTRWGKFKPYLLLTAVPGTLLGLLDWVIPFIFTSDPKDFGKAAMYLALRVIGEAMGTFRGIAQTGYLSTITPHPVDRTRLMVMSNLFSGVFGTGIPNILMGLFIDLINKQKVQWSLKGTYAFMGMFTGTISGAMQFYYFLVSRERVQQSLNTPSLKEGFKSIANNTPLLVATISDCLGSFKISTSKMNYYIDVLGNAMIVNYVGIPGGITSTAGIAAVTSLRKRFSTRTLWIAGGMAGDFTMAVVFLYGIIGGTGKNGFFRSMWKMIPALTIQEFVANGFLGIRRIIPNEIFNECLDYCEWKNGYRTEGMTQVARGFATKILNSIMGSVNPWLMKKYGYNISAGFNEQTDRTKFMLFAYCTIVPFVTSLVGVIPKFFYPLNDEKRRQMYEELIARREKSQHDLNKLGDKDYEAEQSANESVSDYTT